jgi:hypothetical protein
MVMGTMIVVMVVEAKQTPWLRSGRASKPGNQRGICNWLPQALNNIESEVLPFPGRLTR